MLFRSNIYDASGKLIKNVGGDLLQPHRSIDSNQKEFLGGNFVRTFNGTAFVTYQAMNEIFFDFRYQYIQRENFGLNTKAVDHDFGIALRLDF